MQVQLDEEIWEIGYVPLRHDDDLKSAEKQVQDG